MKSFLSWMESEETPALSEPQDKKGEGDMNLDALVERRMKSMIEELGRKGNATKQILSSVGKYIGKMGASNAESKDETDQGDQQAPEQEMQVPQAQPAPAMQQGQPPVRTA
jgi:hypothetical protein